MKYYTLVAAGLIALASCSDSDDDAVSAVIDATNEVADVTTVTSSLSVDITTDKAVYMPGETVNFTIGYVPADAMVRYRTLTTVVSEETLAAKTWAWAPPSTDFTGYMVDIYQNTGTNTENILGTIAVDVSSDWTRYPRYGFVAAFGSDKTESVVAQEMEELARYHINGVQFQDWHYKHHWPLGGIRDNLLESYYDIAYRTNYTDVIKSYIEEQHARGMKAILYNLCYGALDDDGAAEDGVQAEWYIFSDTNHRTKDYHNLKSIGWKSDIYLLDPSNTEWQAYIAQRNDDVYANFDFDGYQIDQLGNRGDRYNYSGTKIDMTDAYASFISAMKTAHPDKRLVMNAVSGYGVQAIAQTGDVDFCYNEMWGSEENFTDLRSTVMANNNYSNNSLRTVFAAYMNYGKSGSSGYFNTPGVLLTDAAIFALGASHLELGGDHMLGNEYFPNSNLKMTSLLKTSMIRYYDFITAYENLLYATATENAPAITCTSSHKLSAWTDQKGPQTGYIVTYSKTVGNRQIINLLNFVSANSTSWRDYNGDMPEPSTLTSIGLKIEYDTTATKVWVASPDQHGGVPVEVAFTQAEGYLEFMVHSLKYWTMIVIE